jgi:penicillin-binding protein 1A
LEDRHGRVVLDLERDIRLEQRRKGNAIQVVSPQNAFVMTGLLKKTVEQGTLYNPSGWGSKFTFRDENGRNFRMPMAGKTGTSQNWADAWTVGYSAYYTTAIWFGFDKPGNSLGLSLTGSTLAGFVWADYMREIHQGLPYRDFVRSSSGVIDMTVCAKSGLLKTPSCNNGEVTLTFLEGTQPVLFCDYHSGNRGMETFRHIELGSMFLDTRGIIGELSMPVLRDDVLLREIQSEQRTNRPAAAPNTSLVPQQLFNPFLNELPNYNPFLD